MPDTVLAFQCNAGHDGIVMAVKMKPSLRVIAGGYCPKCKKTFGRIYDLVEMVIKQEVEQEKTDGG